jgi:hypothetical protein
MILLPAIFVILVATDEMPCFPEGPYVFKGRLVVLRGLTEYVRVVECIGLDVFERMALPHMQEGDLLLLPTAGAYCVPMASNYNLVPRPAVILIDEHWEKLMERRETYDDLLARYV